MTPSAAASLSPEYPLLGLILLEPCHGYQLNRRMQDELGEIWHISQSQLYGLLARLEADGLVTREKKQQEGRPDRYDYFPTPAGREHFEDWLHQPTAASARALRVEFLTRLYFARRADTALAGELVRAQETVLRARLGKLKRRLAQLPEAPLANRLALELRLHQLESFLEWLSDCRVLLRPRNERKET